MNPRKSLQAAVGGESSAGAGGSAGAPRATTAVKPTIVLVHGAWHWAGCFLKVANLLAQHGFPVVAPDLKSHGYAEGTYDQVTDMADYTAPVAAILEAATAPVVLLGHSMGGATLTWLAERHPSKIHTLIYLTAFMTPNGKSANDYIFSPAYLGDPTAAELLKLLAPSADGKGVCLDTTQPELLKAAFYADCPDRDVAVVGANVVPINSIVPYAVQAATTGAAFGSVRRVYVECTADKAIPIAIQRQMQADVPGARVVTLTTGHSPFFSAPEQLARLIAAEAG